MYPESQAEGMLKSKGSVLSAEVEVLQLDPGVKVEETLEKVI